MKFNAQAAVAAANQGAAFVEKLAEMAKGLPGEIGVTAAIVDKAAEVVQAALGELETSLREHDEVAHAETLEAIRAAQAKVDAEVEALAAEVAKR